jgi:hypothetical protein
VGEEGYEREQAQQRRGGAPYSHLRELPLRLYPEMPPRFLEGRLYLPTQDKPPKDLLGLGTKIGAQQGLGGELSLRIAHQYPAYGYDG